MAGMGLGGAPLGQDSLILSSAVLTLPCSSRGPNAGPLQHTSLGIRLVKKGSPKRHHAPLLILTSKCWSIQGWLSSTTYMCVCVCISVCVCVYVCGQLQPCVLSFQANGDQTQPVFTKAVSALGSFSLPFQAKAHCLLSLQADGD
jgi:hypothetical protein